MDQQESRHWAGDTPVRVASVWAIPTVLRKLGADPDKVLAEVGLDTTTFDNPDNLISFAARSRLISHCVARTGCGHFGLLVGQEGGLHSLGLVGLLARQAPDVGTALQHIVRYFHLHAQGSMPGVAIEDGMAMMTFRVYQANTLAIDQIADGALAIEFNIMRTLCGPDWRAIEVRFAHHRPADVQPFRRFFGAPVRFEAERNAVVFAAEWLDRRTPGVDSELRLLLQQQIDALEVRHGDDFPARVRSALRSTLITDHSSADQVAKLFSMHSRTLNRRLRIAGTSFRELVDEIRFEIACQSLEYTSLDVNRIADLLNYADASAFTRAFRRWSGTTPALWRASRSR